MWKHRFIRFLCAVVMITTLGYLAAGFFRSDSDLNKLSTVGLLIALIGSYPACRIALVGVINLNESELSFFALANLGGIMLSGFEPHPVHGWLMHPSQEGILWLVVLIFAHGVILSLYDYIEAIVWTYLVHPER